MQCVSCSSEIPADAAFCPRCGQRLIAKQGEVSAPTDQVAFGQALSGRRGLADDPEVDIWAGTFSRRAMIGTWLGAALLSLLAIVAGVLFAATGFVWAIVGAAIALIWVVAVLKFVYRRMSIRYRLTSQRLFHESGLLTRVIDRIEVIDMDDVTFRQGPLERLLGVGTIRIRSSDTTDPEFSIVGIDNVRDIAALIDAARRREQVRRSVRIDQV